MDYLLLIFLLLNLALLVAIGIFLVKWRDRSNEMFAELLDALETMWGGIPLTPEVPRSERTKTWDEKYEEELDNIQRRLRGDSGLTDLPQPKLSWGEPPSPNPGSSQGLTIQDR